MDNRVHQLKKHIIMKKKHTQKKFYFLENVFLI